MANENEEEVDEGDDYGCDLPESTKANSESALFRVLTSGDRFSRDDSGNYAGKMGVLSLAVSIHVTHLVEALQPAVMMLTGGGKWWADDVLEMEVSIIREPDSTIHVVRGIFFAPIEGGTGGVSDVPIRATYVRCPVDSQSIQYEVLLYGPLGAMCLLNHQARRQPSEKNCPITAGLMSQLVGEYGVGLRYEGTLTTESDNPSHI